MFRIIMASFQWIICRRNDYAMNLFDMLCNNCFDFVVGQPGEASPLVNVLALVWKADGSP